MGVLPVSVFTPLTAFPDGTPPLFTPVRTVSPLLPLAFPSPSESMPGGTARGERRFKLKHRVLVSFAKAPKTRISGSNVLGVHVTPGISGFNVLGSQVPSGTSGSNGLEAEVTAGPGRLNALGSEDSAGTSGTTALAPQVTAGTSRPSGLGREGPLSTHCPEGGRP